MAYNSPTSFWVIESNNPASEYDRAHFVNTSDLSLVHPSVPTRSRKVHDILLPSPLTYCTRRGQPRPVTNPIGCRRRVTRHYIYGSPMSKCEVSVPTFSSP